METTEVVEEGVKLIHVLIGVFVAITTIPTTWYFTRKLVKRQEISKIKKETKINDVEGDEAVAAQLDLMLERVAKMAQRMYDELELKSEANSKILAYEAAFSYLIILCSESCDDPELCKEKVMGVLKKFNLDVK